MLNVEPREENNLFIVRPEGEVTAADFEGLSHVVNDYIGKHGDVPNLVIQTSSLPHWKNLAALSAHFKFVKDHQKLVQKVAVATDSRFLSMLRAVADHFVGAKIRRFPERAVDDAIAWAGAQADDPGSFEILEGFANDVIALRARGIITAQDYRDTLMPLVDEKLKRHDKLKLVYAAGDEFDSYSAGAMWDDARFGLNHFTTFTKIALVSDIDWLRHSAKFFGPLLDGELMVFHNSELEDAKAWIDN